jgi:two-component system OmpR family response regulator
MSQYKVLVVDDEEDFLETIVNRFNKRGITAKGANSGKTALDLLQKESFDIVILDVKMPEMDGIQVLKKIKLNWPDVEVIMLTGHASVELGIEGMEYGAYDYVMKPTKLDILISKMNKAYERKLIRTGQKN